MTQKGNPIRRLYRSLSSAQSIRQGKLQGVKENDEPFDLKFPERTPYSRPVFLSLSAEEQEKQQNHDVRPVVTPKYGHEIPLQAGYAECINGGKSDKNEDQAAVGSFSLTGPEENGISEGPPKANTIPVQYYAIFDGHAGPGAALMAASQLINHLQERLVDITEDLFSLNGQDGNNCKKNFFWTRQRVNVDDLIRGALEASFVAFDEQIAQERQIFRISGGCTALVCLVMLGKLYVAHAGDGRAIALLSDKIITLAREFTPETDGERIQMVASMKPEYTSQMFNDHCFARPLNRKDIGNRVLCRLPQRSGWHYKEVTEQDMNRPPLVAGQGKWARLMGILGVTRGFGDHFLTVPGTSVLVKPFLTPIPEVKVLDLSDCDLTERDMLIMGCDGLWDLLTSDAVAEAARKQLDGASSDDDGRFDLVAARLVHLARGENTGIGWKQDDGSEASFDDITVFVIPLIRCINSQTKLVTKTDINAMDTQCSIDQEKKNNNGV